MGQNQFVIFQSEKDGQWYWHLKSPNGEVLVQGEAHTRPADAQRAMNNVIEIIATQDYEVVMRGQKEGLR